MFYISTENDKNSPDIKWKKKKKPLFPEFYTFKCIICNGKNTSHICTINLSRQND